MPGPIQELILDCLQKARHRQLLFWNCKDMGRPGSSQDELERSQTLLLLRQVDTRSSPLQTTTFDKIIVSGRSGSKSESLGHNFKIKKKKYGRPAAYTYPYIMYIYMCMRGSGLLSKGAGPKFLPLRAGCPCGPPWALVGPPGPLRARPLWAGPTYYLLRCFIQPSYPSSSRTPLTSSGL